MRENYTFPIFVCFYECARAAASTLSVFLLSPATLSVFISLFQENPVPAWTKPCDHLWPKGMHAADPTSSDVSPDRLLFSAHVRPFKVVFLKTWHYLRFLSGRLCLYLSCGDTPDSTTTVTLESAVSARRVEHDV